MPYPVDLQSEHWKTFRREARAYYGDRCFVCDFDYRKRQGGHIQVNHATYERANREWISDVFTICDRHHRKGRYTRQQARYDRQAYQTMKVMDWLFLLPFRLVRAIVLLVCKLLRKRQ